MRSIEALKEKARRHEQNEEWQPARDLYMQAIAAMDDDAQFDIGLHNRVGDILVKIGDYETAVEHYQRATDLYLEAELPNNAIAVCKKVVRHLPGRNEVYLRMGQIRASQGFLVDARENFLIYAAKVEEAGDTEEALRALIEFAALAPEDTEIRLALARQLEAHGRTDEALDQLVAGYRVLRERGEEERAAEYAERIRSLDPEVDPDGLADAVQQASLQATALADDHGAEDSFEASFGEIELTEEPEAPGPSEGRADPGALSEAAPDPGEPTIVEADFGEIVLASDDEEDEAAPESAGDLDASVSPVETPATDAEGAEDSDDRTVDVAGDLPLISFGEGEGSGPEESLQARAEDDEEEAPLPFLDLGGDEAAFADVEPSGPPVDEPRDAPTDWGALRGAYDPARPDVEGAENLLEAAFQGGGDPAVLVEAYELLARALEATGDEARAADVRGQILALDPEHLRGGGASEALGEGAPESASEGESPTPSAAGAEETSYVDLGSLVFGVDERSEKTTRFQVAYQEPSGDEAADFANMLAQFKAKVAENFDAADVRAHHDLGTAYKEMGLLDEAVSEFQQALRASADHLPTYELLGQTFMERGEHAAAVRVLERAMKVPSEVEDELIGIYYYLGRAHQELGQVDEAVGFYDRVFALDINFADVTTRLRELR